MSALLRLLAMLALALGFAAPAQAGSYTVNSSGDSWINEASISQNNGTVTTLRATANGSGAARTRPVIYFAMPAIPSNETITSATLQLRVTTTTTRTVTVHRLTAAWTETGVTWSNFSNSFNAAAEASFTPSTAATISIDVTGLVQAWASGTANHGLGMMGAASSGAVFASEEHATSTYRPQLIITTARISPSIFLVKSNSLISDPLNGTSNPKAIPGAKVRWTIGASNSTAGTADSNTTIFVDAVPAGMKMCIGDIGGAGSGPVSFTDGSPSSGLSYSYSSLGSTTDSLAFSANGGSTFGYTPSPDPDGCDTAITHVQVSLTGAFAGKTGVSSPGFTLQMLMQVE